MAVVTTKEELKKAIKRKEPEIFVENEDLSKQIVNFKKIKNLSRWKLSAAMAAVGAGILAAPFTAGGSLLITTGGGATISTSAIVAIGVLFILGSAILMALYRDYDVEIEGDGEEASDDNEKPKRKGRIKVTLKKRK